MFIETFSVYGAAQAKYERGVSDMDFNVSMVELYSGIKMQNISEQMALQTVKLQMDDFSQNAENLVQAMNNVVTASHVDVSL